MCIQREVGVGGVGALLHRLRNHRETFLDLIQMLVWYMLSILG